MNVIDILIQYREGFLSGLSVTLQLCLLIWTSGLLLGTALGVAGAKWQDFVGLPSQIGSFLLSGVPVLVFLFWLHYPVQMVFNVVIDPFYTAVATLSIVNTFAVADAVRRVLCDFPRQYTVTAQVCGIPPWESFWHIQLPIVLRQVVPALLLIQVSMLHMTLFASLISVDEIFRAAQRINAKVYKPVEIYTALGLFFLAVCLPLNGLALWLRHRFTRDLSEN